MRNFWAIVSVVAVVVTGLIVFRGQRELPAQHPAKLPAPPPSSAYEFVDVTDQALKSAVKVMIFKPRPHPKLANVFVATPSPDGIGSGVVWKTVNSAGHVDCLILTNHHVIAGAEKTTIHFRNRLEYPAELIGTDPVTEVALLRIRVPKEETPPAIKIRKTPLRIAEKVLAIGSPLDQPFSVSQGIISALSRRPGIGTGYEDYIQTDAAVNPGNSGGPLIDARSGKLIGINTAILGNTNLGIAFAIPSDLAAEIAKRMLTNKGKVWHGFAGLKVDDTPSGVKVLWAMSRPSGQQPFKVNDILTQINAEIVADARTCRCLFDRCKPGSKARVSVNRENKVVQFEILIEDFEKYFTR